MGEITNGQWYEAIEHFRHVRLQYLSLGMAGVPALAVVFGPLWERYRRGERSQELYDSMVGVE